MDNCPAEIWYRIFSLACTDDGYTGQSLSRVSRYFRSTSRSVQLQSVAISGECQMREFADMLDKRPSGLRCVRHLFISHRDNRRRSTRSRLGLGSCKALLSQEELLEAFVHQGYDYSEEDFIRTRMESVGADWSNRGLSPAHQRRKTSENILHRILELVAPCVQTLTLHVGTLYPRGLKTLHFPNLAELTLQSVSPLLSGIAESNPQPPILGMHPLPSLRCLHLVDCCDDLVEFLGRAPVLRRLRLTGMSRITPRILEALSMALTPSSASVREGGEKLHGLAKLERIMIRTADHTRNFVWRGAINALRAMARDHSNFILLRCQIDGQTGYKPSESKVDWMERMVGGEGCWRVHPGYADERRIRIHYLD